MLSASRLIHPYIISTYVLSHLSSSIPYARTQHRLFILLFSLVLPRNKKPSDPTFFPYICFSPFPSIPNIVFFLPNVINMYTLEHLYRSKIFLSVTLRFSSVTLTSASLTIFVIDNLRRVASSVPLPTCYFLSFFLSSACD